MKRILRVCSSSANDNTEGSPHLTKATSLQQLCQAALEHPRQIIKRDTQNRDVANTNNPQPTTALAKTSAQPSKAPQLNLSYQQILDQEAIQLFLQRQSHYFPDTKLLANQKYVRPTHRSQAMYYYSELHDQYELKITTLLLAGNILDRFLNVHCVSDAMQLYKAINCSASIAMKIEEIYPPTMDELMKKSDKSILVGMAKYQQIIVTKLDFKLQKLSPYNFFQGLQNTRKLNSQEKYISFYLLELYMQDYVLVGSYTFSLVAQAIDHFIHILRTGSSNGWSNTFGIHSRAHIDQVATYLFKLATQAKKSIREIYDKYAKPKFLSVSLNRCFIPVKPE